MAALKHLVTVIERLESQVGEIQSSIEAMKDEFTIDFGEEEEEEATDTDSSSDEDSDDAQSVQSAPATFSYKRQRTT